jgi:hypothetical protein
VAARRSQAQAMLTEQAETFITGQYQTAQYQTGHTGDYPTAVFPPTAQRTGEYRQYQGGAPAAAGQPVTGGYPAYGGQNGQNGQNGYNGQSSQNGQNGYNGYNGQSSQNGYNGQNGHSAQPARAAGGLSGSGSGAWPAQSGGVPNGRYDAQPQQRPQSQPRQAAPLPAAPLPAPVANGSASAAKGGLNPYDVAITGSYPYPGQSYPAALPPAASSAPASADDPYYRPLPADGAGYGASYGNGYQDPRDRRY